MEEDCKIQKPWHCTLWGWLTWQRVTQLTSWFLWKMQGHGHPAPTPTQSLSPATHTCDDGLETDYADDPESWRKAEAALRTWLYTEPNTSVKGHLCTTSSGLMLEPSANSLSKTSSCGCLPTELGIFERQEQNFCFLSLSFLPSTGSFP